MDNQTPRRLADPAQDASNPNPAVQCRILPDAARTIPEIAVNGTVIPQRLIAAEMQNFPSGRFETSWPQTVRALIIRELLLQQARRLELRCSPQTDTQGCTETTEDGLIRALIEREIEKVQPDPAHVRRHYDDHPQRFMTPMLYEVEHILISARQDDVAAFAAARTKANQLHGLLMEAPERFAELARLFSDCISRTDGGHLGQIGPGDTTAPFEAVLRILSPGDISAPVETRYGIHLIRLTRRIESQPLPFAAVSASIAAHLTEQAWRRAIAGYIAQLIERAEIHGFTFAPSGEPLKSGIPPSLSPQEPGTMA